MKKLADLLAQRDALEAQIAEAKRTELDEVIAEIKNKIAAYDLTYRDIFGDAKRGRKARGAAGKATAVAPKYRDPETGATWTGRGKTPKWLQGKDRALFAI